MKKDGVFKGVALFTAILTSLCCLGPLLFIALGLGISGFSLVATYRPLIIFITIIFLILAFYFTYKKRAITCEDGSCKLVGGSRRSKIVLWIITILAVIFMFVPYWLPCLVSIGGQNTFNSEQLAKTPHEEILMDIHDMYCPACAAKIQKKLQEINGVLAANVDYDKKIAIVDILPNAVTYESLIETIKSEGYTADVRTKYFVDSLQKKELKK